MERIKSALDKARAKRDRLASSRPHSVTNSERSVVRSAVAANKSGIVYDQTTVVELDEDLLEANRIITHNKSDTRGAAFDILRTKVLQNMERNNAKTLAITSATPENGKTVIAINLAFSIAQNSKNSVLLIDFDLRRPAVGKYLGVTHKPSLYDYLNGEATLNQTLINPGKPRIVVATNDRSIVNASEALASQQVADLIKEARDRYSERTIIFDLPPILGVDDALVVLPHIDASLLVVGAGDSSAGEVEEAHRLLDEHNLIGVIMNKTNAKPAGYY